MHGLVRTQVIPYPEVQAVTNGEDLVVELA
jgi:hypothetical protein